MEEKALCIPANAFLFMRKLTITFLLPVLLLVITFAWSIHRKPEKNLIALYAPQFKRIYQPPLKEFLKLQTKAVAAKAFIKQRGFDTAFYFLIDMSLPANHKRFFVYEFGKDTVQISGLVAHGNCNQYWLEGRKYGNEWGCGCTSLGKYKIGNSYYGRFGLAFKLYGLNATNSNAFSRYVVLHSHDCMPETEVEEEVCQSNGCPMVAPGFLKQLAPMIKKARQPVLLWIFE
jgi:hypothetical protein